MLEDDLKQNFILIMYEDKSYDKKMYSKLMLNTLKVMGGPTPTFTSLGIYLKKTSIKVFACALIKETS
jgi:hypothetical protein